jgi:Zn-dependent metalloprotease
VFGVVLAVITTAVVAPAAASAAPVTNEAVAIARAQEAIGAHPKAIQGGADDQYSVWRTIIDDDGSSHVRYRRTHRGLRVLGGDFVVHNGPDGSFRGATGGLRSPLSVDSLPSINAVPATATARSQFKGRIDKVGTPELVIDAATGTGTLAWETLVSGVSESTKDISRLHVLVDARSGKHLRSFDDVKSVEGLGEGVYEKGVPLDTTQLANPLRYELRDPARANSYTCDLMNKGTENSSNDSCSPMISTSNYRWGNGSQSDRNSAAVDVHFGTWVWHEYFKNVHGRNGVYGDGRGIPAKVHWGNNVNNAHFVAGGAGEDHVAFGDGSGNASPFTSIDIVGHEFTHGLTQYTAALDYSGESGGLNEATSDIFGVMTDFHANSATPRPNYEIGERITGNRPRFMYDPSLDGKSDSCWSSGTAYKDVHYSSGVGNHFFFLLAEGSGATAHGTSPTCDGSTVTGIGQGKAAEIWFRALNVYFTSNTEYGGYNGARNATLRAAEDLYGYCGTEYRTVQAAWKAVAVAATHDSPCSDRYPPKCPRIAVNDANAAIPDGRTGSPGTPARSEVQVTGCEGNATQGIRIDVDVKHTFRGDLSVVLYGPGNSSWVLKNNDFTDGRADIKVFFIVDARTVTADGTWRLEVQDFVRADTGYIDSWSLSI